MLTHRADEPRPDTPRPVATDRDSDFVLSIEEVSERYARAGHPRTIRTLQRYCVSSHLDAQKVATTLGDKYLVTPQSVARHIAQIEELHSLDSVAAYRARPRPVATATSAQDAATPQATATATDGGERSTATAVAIDLSPYLTRLEREVEQAKDEREFLREQINRKDKTIEALIERDRETNFLVRGLQEMLTPLLGARRDIPPQNIA